MNDNIAIKIENLSKCYTLRNPVLDDNGNETYEHWALKDVSLEIKKGESAGIIGPNGSGKSTLLKILAGVTKPTSGKVTINGRVASILDVGAGFHPELSGRENVFLNGQIHGFSKKEIAAKFDEIVEFSGIAKYIDEPVKNYSSGMFLRLAFSIIIHLDFDVYLFDEVLSVGDAEFGFKVNSKLKELIGLNKTILLVSHNFNDLSNLNKYIHFESGVIKSISSKMQTITDYIESALVVNNYEIHTQNVIVNDFSDFPKFEDIVLLEVKLIQSHETEFRTDKEFTFSIKFKKLTESDYLIDLAILINDIQGNIVLTTNPLLSGFPSNSQKGIYSYTCTFPSSIFGFQVYRISVLFIQNILNTVRMTENSVSFSRIGLGNIIKTSLRMENIITFKPKFKIKGMDVTNNTISINGGLLPVLEWKLNFEENEIKK